MFLPTTMAVCGTWKKGFVIDHTIACTALSKFAFRTRKVSFFRKDGKIRKKNYALDGSFTKLDFINSVFSVGC